MKYSIVNKPLKKREGRNVYEAYKHFDTREQAEKWCRNKLWMPMHNYEIIEERG